MSRADLAWYRLRWPRTVEAEQVTQLFRILATTAGSPVVIEAVSAPGVVDHRLGVPQARAGSVVQQLRSVVAGLGTEKLQVRESPKTTRAVELRTSTRRRPLRVDDLATTSRALLTSLAHVGQDEHLALQWVLGRRLAPVAVPNQLPASSLRSWVATLLSSSPSTSRLTDVDVRNALRAKQSEPGWRVAGRLAVQAETEPRQRQLIGQVLGAMRVAESPSVEIRARSVNPHPLNVAKIPWRLPLRLNLNEVAALSTVPVGPTADLPVARVGSRLLAPSRSIPAHGRVVGEATFPGRERPVSLLPEDARRHTHIIGPSGSGKSNLMLTLAVQDVAAGRGVVVIEPRGDLIAEILRRIPQERVADVVIIDPTDPDDSRPVGLNPLAAGGRPPELVADQLLGIFHDLFPTWGARLSDILASALLTLARIPGMTLAALPLLLSNAGFRRGLLVKIDDPIGLEPFWASYESWSEQERSSAIAPAMRRLRPFLLRPDVRAIVGQAEPRFDVRQVFTQGKILLVNLSKGLLGSETASVVGSLVVSAIWQATLGRASIAPERRHPVFVYTDEYQEYLRLPTDFTEALAQARGLGVGFVLAHQYMHQLDPAMRSAVLANAQSRIAFRLPNEDARLLASGALQAEDFEDLGAFQAYAQLVAHGAVQPWFSLRTLPPGPPSSDPGEVRASSRSRYGVDRHEVEADIRRLVGRPRTSESDDLAPRRRPRRSE